MRKIKLKIVPVLLFFIFTFSVSADTIGDNRQFFISPQYDIRSRAVIDATLKHVSGRAYFYVADDYWDNVSITAHGPIVEQIKLLAQEFDDRIYPIETQFFGAEPNPGIDGDPRITILLTPLIENAGGYFDTTNQYLNTEALHSNQREMIYLNIRELGNQNKMFPFLAHEFQHLISFNQKEKLRNVSDDIWLNELRSEYAPTLLGYNDVFEGSHLQKRARALAENPSDSLTEWKNLPADYGQIGIFGEYIAEYWFPRVIADTLKNSSVGFSSLAEALTKNGFSDKFLDVFRDWLTANFINDSSVNPKFGYSKVNLADFRVAPTQTISGLDGDPVFFVSDSIKDWQGRWYDITQLKSGDKNVLKISFNSPSLASFYVSYLVFKPDGTYQNYGFNPTPASDAVYVSGIGSEVNRVVVMPIKKDKISGFLSNETPVTLITSIERIVSLPDGTASSTLVSSPIFNPVLPAVTESEPAARFADGSLIRAKGGANVYVIKGRWRRHILDARIFNFYPGLGFDKVIEVDPPVLNQYQGSNLVRYAGSQRVYSVDESGGRHWLNMTGEQFTASGRSWDSIFEVNLRELNFYKIGTNIAE